MGQVGPQRFVIGALALWFGAMEIAGALPARTPAAQVIDVAQPATARSAREADRNRDSIAGLLAGRGWIARHTPLSPNELHNRLLWPHEATPAAGQPAGPRRWIRRNGVWIFGEPGVDAAAAERRDSAPAANENRRMKGDLATRFAPSAIDPTATGSINGLAEAADTGRWSKQGERWVFVATAADANPATVPPAAPELEMRWVKQDDAWVFRPVRIERPADDRSATADTPPRSIASGSWVRLGSQWVWRQALGADVAATPLQDRSAARPPSLTEPISL